MKALIIGATGATGKQLVAKLLEDNTFTEVHVFIRKPLGTQHNKLQTHIVDFDTPEDWAYLVRGNVAFACLGTTIKQAGSQEAQRKVDFDYQLNFAKKAKANGVSTFVLVSSYGAKAQSRIFYSRIKGELEEAVKKLNFDKNVILQPSILDRGVYDRIGENIGLKLIKTLNRIGLFKRYRPMPTAILAEKMIKLAKIAQQGMQTVTLDSIFEV